MIFQYQRLDEYFNKSLSKDERRFNIKGINNIDKIIDSEEFSQIYNKIFENNEYLTNNHTNSNLDFKKSSSTPD